MDGTLLCETAPFYMNWLVMLHRLLDDPAYTPTEPTTPTAVRPAGSAALVPSQPSYTLDGRRLVGQPSHVGVYINNGNKTVIK